MNNKENKQKIIAYFFILILMSFLTLSIHYWNYSKNGYHLSLYYLTFVFDLYFIVDTYYDKKFINSMFATFTKLFNFDFKFSFENELEILDLLITLLFIEINISLIFVFNWSLWSLKLESHHEIFAILLLVANKKLEQSNIKKVNDENKVEE